MAAKVKTIKKEETSDPDTIDFETGKTDNESGLAIEDNVPVPEFKRRKRKTKYPFDQLEIGQSFFVPADEKLVDPVKQLGSTVSSANRRYKKEDGTYERRFAIDEAESKGVKGARIWRVEVK